VHEWSAIGTARRYCCAVLDMLWYAVVCWRYELKGMQSAVHQCVVGRRQVLWRVAESQTITAAACYKGLCRGPKAQLTATADVVDISAV
jgi:hypothetical protein